MRWCAILSLAVTIPVVADFHDWRIEQVFSDASGKVQYIELGGVTDSGEGFLSGHAVASNAKSVTFPTDLPNQDTAGKGLLFGTSSYAKQSGAATPDYVLPDNFFSPSGDTIDYAGVDSFTFTGAQLPKDGVTALNVDFSTTNNHQRNFLGEEGSVSVQSGPPSAIPLPAAVYPGLLMLGGLIATTQVRRKAYPMLCGWYRRARLMIFCSTSS